MSSARVHRVAKESTIDLYIMCGKCLNLKFLSVVLREEKSRYGRGCIISYKSAIMMQYRCTSRHIDFADAILVYCF